MAVNLSPVAGAAAQFLDNSGNVLTGGKLYTYAAGTTTPQATYTTNAGNVFHTNPIILDASGRVPAAGEIWLTDALIYKFILKDANDVLIATWDNLSGINSNYLDFAIEEEIQTATAGQTVFTLTTINYQPGTNNLSVFVDGINQYDGVSYNYVETNSTTVTFNSGLTVGAKVKFTTSSIVGSGITSSQYVNYTAAGTGAVTTTVQAKLRESVSVLDFGADPTGAVSSVTAFQNTINATLNSGVETAFVPSGTYLGDMTALTYGSRTGFVWEEAGGVTYSTAAPKSTVAQGVGLVVVRTNAKVSTSIKPTTVGQVGFEYDPLGLAGENPNVVIIKNSTYTAGTSNNPSALNVTTNITSNTDTKDNAIISVINDTSALNIAQSRTAIMSQANKKSANRSNFIASNFIVSDQTGLSSTNSPGSCVASEINCAASGPDDGGIFGQRTAIEINCTEYTASADGPTSFMSGVRINNDADSTIRNGVFIKPNSTGSGGITNAFAVQGGTVDHLLFARNLTNQASFDLGTTIDSGTIFQNQVSAYNSSSNLVAYGRLQCTILDNTASSEDGQWVFQTRKNGVTGFTVGVGDGMIVGGAATGGYKGAGTINVQAGVYLNGTAYTNPDYVFEQAYTGKIEKFADKLGADTYQPKTIEEAQQYTKDNLALPGFGQEAHLDYLGGSEMLLARLEEAYLYIFELNERIKKLENK